MYLILVSTQLYYQLQLMVISVQIQIIAMRKGARSGTSKHSKQRKHIQIKQSNLISPIKQVAQQESSRLSLKGQKSLKSSVPSLPKIKNEFTSDEIMNLSSHSDSLISIQIMRASIKKQESGLEEFLTSCPDVVKRAFQKALRNVQGSFNFIKQERMERMKQDTVIFVPPDKDNFQKQKGQTLNNWIKQQMQTHRQKQNFEKEAEAYNDIFKDTQKRITQLSLQMPKENVQPNLEKTCLKVNQQNQETINNKLTQLTFQIREILETADAMRQLKEEVMQNRRKKQFRKQFEIQRYLIERVPTHSMALFSIEDYFL